MFPTTFVLARTDCTTTRDEDGNWDSWRKQSASLLITWFVPLVPDTNQTATGDPIMDDIDRLRYLFDKTIGSRVPFELVATKQMELNMIKSIDTNITLVSSEEDVTGMLSRPVADALLELVDCSKKCKILQDDLSSYHYQVHMKPKSSWFEDYGINHLNPINVYLHLRQPLRSSEGECSLCDILAQNTSFVLTATSVINRIVGILRWVLTLLEPRHWLALVLAIWLSACFIIAMLIKRRDKRRLRLYLEERADYSFSAKR